MAGVGSLRETPFPQTFSLYSLQNSAQQKPPSIFGERFTYPVKKINAPSPGGTCSRTSDPVRGAVMIHWQQLF